MHKKKILFFHHEATISGAGISALNIIKSIDKDLYDVTVFSKYKYGGIINLFENLDIKVLTSNKTPIKFNHCIGSELFVFSFSAIKNYLALLFDYKNVKKVIESVDPDIIVVNSMTLFWIGRIAETKKINIVCFFRETYYKGLVGVRNRIIKYFFNKYFDKIAFISKFDLNQNLNVKCVKKVIYNVIDQSLYNKSSIELQEFCNQHTIKQSQFNILFVGGLSKLKGTHIIIKSLTLLKEKNVVLHIVGYEWNGERVKLSECKTWRRKIRYLIGLDYKRNVINFIIKNHLTNKIKFHKSQTQISSFYLSCNLLVFPSTRPHQARPLFEAGFARMPAIVSNYKNLNEFANNANCFLFENGNYRHLASQILYVMKNQDIVAQKIEKNYQDCVSKHSFYRYSTQINSLLQFN